MIARPIQLLPDTQLESFESLNTTGTECFSVGGALVSEETPRKKLQRGESKKFNTWCLRQCCTYSTTDNNFQFAVSTEHELAKIAGIKTE